MNESTGRRIGRKLSATIVATFVFSMALCVWGIAMAEETVYRQATEFYAMTLAYFYYIGMFVLIYGNLVAVGIESLQRKFFEQADWLYVLILGAFGSAIGLLVPDPGFILVGILVAMLYGVIDKWLLKRWQEDKGNKTFFIAPVIAFLLLWIYFLLASPALPPHTAEEAVAFITSGEGTSIDRFPNEVGTWSGEIEGYQVERTTSVKRGDEETYIVTFTEKWQKGTIDDSWTMSYRVDRDSSTFHGEEGEMPPYDR